jgi:ribosome-binding protein aMBF1 (putative translation factor)
MMTTKRRTLTEIKASVPESAEREQGYWAADAAIRIGERVRAQRERCGLTQAELARRMGVTQPTIARLEAGGTTPNMGTLRRIAEALGLELVIDFREVTAAGQ